MGEVRYMISEAAKQVQVESHVLRYWEEELGLEIGRTEMGHRYYTKDDIQLFLCIQKLKNEGMLLRDLKPLIPELTKTRKKINAARTQQEKSAMTDKLSDPAEMTSMSMERTSAPTGTSDSNDAQDSKIRSLSASDSMNAQKTAFCSGEKKHFTQTQSFTEPAPALAAQAPADLSVSTPALSETEVIPVTQLEQVRSLIGDVLTEVVTTNNAILKKEISRKVTADVIREMDFLFQANERREEEHYRKLDCLIRQQQNNRREAARENPIGKLRKLLT